jgi:hypothetical protein
MTDHDPEAYVDPRQAVHLCAEGAPEYTAVAAVGRDGHTKTYWLWHGTDRGPAYPGDPPAHEHVGPLPTHVQARVDRAARPRCGQPRADGQPCRNRVGQHGDDCPLHRSRSPR